MIQLYLQPVRRARGTVATAKTRQGSRPRDYVHGHGTGLQLYDLVQLYLVVGVHVHVHVIVRVTYMRLAIHDTEYSYR